MEGSPLAFWLVDLIGSSPSKSNSHLAICLGDRMLNTGDSIRWRIHLFHFGTSFMASLSLSSCLMMGVTTPSSRASIPGVRTLRAMTPNSLTTLLLNFWEASRAIRA